MVSIYHTRQCLSESVTINSFSSIIKNFVDNIRASEFNERAKGIADWIEENKDNEWAKDPNAYEMTNVFLFAGKYASEGKDINTAFNINIVSNEAGKVTSKNGFDLNDDKEFDDDISMLPVSMQISLKGIRSCFNELNNVLVFNKSWLFIVSYF